MTPETQRDEHRWLERFVGEWEGESECRMGPDQPPSVTKGRVSARMLGGLWLLIEMTSPGEDGQPMDSLITLGFDATQGKFVGSFIASLISFHWLYSGTIDPQSGELVLDARGPRFDGQPGLADYQDMIGWQGDQWTLSSRVKQDNGSWSECFMNAKYRRASR